MTARESGCPCDDCNFDDLLDYVVILCFGNLSSGVFTAMQLDQAYKFEKYVSRRLCQDFLIRSKLGPCIPKLALV